MQTSTLQKGLIYHLKADGNARDATPYGNHGTVTAATLTTDRKGQSNKAYDFNGTSAKIAVANATPLGMSGMTELSIAFWINAEGTTNNDRYVNKFATSPLRGFNIDNQDPGVSGGLRFEVFNDSGTSASISDTGVITPDTWTHVVVTFKGSTATTGIQIYNNGALKKQATTSIASIGDNSGNSLWIMAGSGGGGNFVNGALDDLRIYNRQLSATEIASLYNEYSPGVAISTLQKGLVGHWKFDGNPRDASPYENHGTVVDGTLATDQKGQSNKAYSFDGTNDYINIPDSTSLRITTTVSGALWVKFPASPAGTGQFFIREKGGASGDYWFNASIGGNFGVSADGGVGGVTGTTTIAADTWYHIAFTYQVNDLHLYVNGVEEGTPDTSVGAPTGASSLPIRVGGGYPVSAPTSFRTASINDVRIYNRILSSTEVLALYQSYSPSIAVSTLQSGLVGHWKMDGNAKDSTPNSNHGTVTGATLTTDRKGQSNKAYTFNGTTNYIDTADSNNFSPFVNDNMTISFWVYFNSVTSSNVIIGKAEASNYEWAIYPNSVTTWTSSGANHATLTSYASSATTGIWYHYTLVITDGDTTATSLAFYRDGISISATLTQTANSMSNTGSKVTIGRRGDNQDYFSGVVDDVRIYNRALSATEITALYNQYK